MKYLFYMTFLLASCSNDESITYKLIDPQDSGEQYLTQVDSNLFYYGRVKELELIGAEKVSYAYFLSKAVNTGPSLNGVDDFWFYDFQHAEKPLGITDWDSSKFDTKGVMFSFDTYRAMWGELIGDTVVLNAIKHTYYGRYDSIKFSRVHVD